MVEKDSSALSMGANEAGDQVDSSTGSNEMSNSSTDVCGSSGETSSSSTPYCKKVPHGPREEASLFGKRKLQQHVDVRCSNLFVCARSGMSVSRSGSRCCPLGAPLPGRMLPRHLPPPVLKAMPL